MSGAVFLDSPSWHRPSRGPLLHDRLPLDARQKCNGATTERPAQVDDGVRDLALRSAAIAERAIT